MTRLLILLIYLQTLVIIVCAPIGQIKSQLKATPENDVILADEALGEQVENTLVPEGNDDLNDEAKNAEWHPKLNTIAVVMVIALIAILAIFIVFAAKDPGKGPRKTPNTKESTSAVVHKQMQHDDVLRGRNLLRRIFKTRDNVMNQLNEAVEPLVKIIKSVERKATPDLGSIKELIKVMGSTKRRVVKILGRELLPLNPSPKNTVNLECISSTSYISEDSDDDNGQVESDAFKKPSSTEKGTGSAQKRREK